MDLALGYNFNFGKRNDEDTVTRRYHLLEVGIWRTNFFFTRHWGGAGYYVTTEIGLNTRHFLIGPKIGGFITYGPLLLGNEFCWYTDFREGSLRWIPYFGIGDNRFKLTLNPQLVLSNKDFEYLNFVNLHFSIRVANLWRKKVAWPGLKR